jgi:peptide/nickel transport system substrate-binding protein
MTARGPLEQAYREAKAGRLSRRGFLERAMALGVGLPVAAVLANNVTFQNAAAQEATPSPVQGRPSAGTEGQERGAGGELRLLQWQAVSTLSPHNSTGTKDSLGATLVYEPLMNYLPDGSLIPNLVKEVPSLENGGLSEDLTTVTYNLLDGVLWSDGTPFTAHDVAATYAWIVDPVNAATTINNFLPLASVEAVDDLTVTLTFKQGSVAWFIPFSGTNNGFVYPKHILDQGEAAAEILRTSPIGTGPYKVESFFENDQVIYVINENYREPNKPFFATVNLKGGGDPASAAQAVLQTGDYDLAWNPQVEPQILRQLESAGNGVAVFPPGPFIEGVFPNFSDPNTEVNGQRSEKNTPHPFLTDPAVRKALDLATDRETISTQFYSGAPGEPATANTLTGIPAYESANTSFVFDPEQARQAIEAAGWALDGDVRAKDGVSLSLTLSTTVNPVRQKTQAVLKSNWEDVGFEVNLAEVDSTIFFDPSPGNDQNSNHFYNDTQMWTLGAASPYPQDFMSRWYAGPDGSNIAQAENDWSGFNVQRFVNAEYDQLWETLGSETDPERAAETFIRLNDILWEQTATIPLVQRSAGNSYAINNRLNAENVLGHSWEVVYWNIANWNLAAR